MDLLDVGEFGICPPDAGPARKPAGSRLHKGGQSSKSVTLIGSVGFQVLTVGPDTAGRSLPSTVAGLGV